MLKTELYPLLFDPIFKERIWGGDKLQTVLGKNIPSKNIGESWELSTVEGDVSVISNGSLRGKSLQDVINQFPEAILGKHVYKQFGSQFPLLFKFLDAKEDLSIQLHPNDDLARKRHNSFGKTEMWYVMQADENARLIVGFKEKSTPEQYLEHLNNKTLITILDEINVKKGDVFFLETGTIHAIGAGIMIAEIQQTSDITYRLYDFNRIDANGNTRELHIDLALDAINYEKVNAKKEYLELENKSNEIVDCPYFTTNIISLKGSLNIENDKDSFKVYMCTEGEINLITPQAKTKIVKGQTVLLPACITDYELVGEATLLEIFVK